MSDRYDPPGGESVWLPRAPEQTRDERTDRRFGSLSGGIDAPGPMNGAIIPFEQFARRKVGSADLYGYPLGSGGSSTSSLIPSASPGGQMALYGTITPTVGVGQNTAEEPGEQHLIFSLESYECGMKTEYIQTVERLPEVTPVPHVVSWIDGVVHLRGQIISVVDLRSFLGLERQAPSSRTRLVAAKVGDLVIGLVVDGISEMRGILPNMIQSQQLASSLPAWAAPYIGGIAQIGNRSVMILDMERLLLSEKMHRYQAGD